VAIYATLGLASRLDAFLGTMFLILFNTLAALLAVSALVVLRRHGSSSMQVRALS
jgi:hypothetical protein